MDNVQNCDSSTQFNMRLQVVALVCTQIRGFQEVTQCILVYTSRYQRFGDIFSLYLLVSSGLESSLSKHKYRVLRI
jgi:hypothetical protein